MILKITTKRNNETTSKDYSRIARVKMKYVGDS